MYQRHVSSSNPQVWWDAKLLMLVKQKKKEIARDIEMSTSMPRRSNSRSDSTSMDLTHIPSDRCDGLQAVTITGQHGLEGDRIAR